MEGVEVPLRPHFGVIGVVSITPNIVISSIVSTIKVYSKLIMVEVTNVLLV